MPRSLCRYRSSWSRCQNARFGRFHRHERNAAPVTNTTLPYIPHPPLYEQASFSLKRLTMLNTPLPLPLTTRPCLVLSNSPSASPTSNNRHLFYQWQRDLIVDHAKKLEPSWESKGPAPMRIFTAPINSEVEVARNIHDLVWVLGGKSKTGVKTDGLNSAEMGLKPEIYEKEEAYFYVRRLDDGRPSAPPAEVMMESMENLTAAGVVPGKGTTVAANAAVPPPAKEWWSYVLSMYSVFALWCIVVFSQNTICPGRWQDLKNISFARTLSSALCVAVKLLLSRRGRLPFSSRERVVKRDWGGGGWGGYSLLCTPDALPPKVGRGIAQSTVLIWYSSRQSSAAPRSRLLGTLLLPRSCFWSFILVVTRVGHSI